MYVISTDKCFTLVFSGIKDLEAVTNHLKGFLEYAKQNPHLPQPLLYATYDDHTPSAEIEEYLNILKKQLVKTEQKGS